MDTRKLLIADASPAFCGALSEALGGVYDLRICGDGVQAVMLLETFQPDVLVTDLALPGLDGIAVLKNAAAQPRRPAMLVLTRYRSPYIENAIGEVGVDYMMLKPCDMRALVERIHDLSMSEGDSVGIPCTRTGVSNVLLALGISPGRKGYTYLERIIELYRQDPNRSLTKELYPQVARENRTSGISVERAIRGVIQTAWNQRDEGFWRCYFPPSREGFVPRPTNREFIATMAERMISQERRLA